MDQKTFVASQSSLDELLKFVRAQSYREGDFTLASGKKSSFYVNLKLTTLHPRGAKLIGALGFEKIKSLGLALDAVGGLTLGADPIATALSLAAFDRGVIWPALLVRKDAKGHGTGQSVEGHELVTRGARVLVLEDVTTTGGSALTAAEKLREAGLNPIGVLTVIDREDGGTEKLGSAGLTLYSLLKLSQIQNYSTSGNIGSMNDS